MLQCCVRGMYFSQHTFDSWEDSLCKRSWELKPSLFPYWLPELLFLMLPTDIYLLHKTILSCSHKEHCMRCIWEHWRWMHVYLSQPLSGCLSLEIGERMLDLLFSTVKKKKKSMLWGLLRDLKWEIRSPEGGAKRVLTEMRVRKK